jgi:N-acetylneuraminic acid mutarotase
MPTPRTEVAVAALDGLIYVIGGFEGDGTPSAKVEVYDPATDTWSEAAPLPEARHHAAAVEVFGKLWVVGGMRSGRGEAVSSAFAYDAEEDTWGETGSSMAVPHGAPGVVNDGTRPYVISGVQEDPDGELENVSAVEVFMYDAWVRQTYIPTPRDHLGAAAIGFRLYAIGGRTNFDFARNLDSNEEYNIQSREWTTRAPMPTARSGIAAAAIGGRIFVFGGESPDGTFDENEAYDPETDTWATMAPMPTARHGLGAAVVGDTIYVIGGGPEPGLSVTGANEAYTPPPR